MGKIRLKVVGDETAEQEQKQKARARKEGKKAQIKGVGLGGGQRISTVGVSEEEIREEVSRVSGVSSVPQGNEEQDIKARDTRGTGGTRGTRKHIARVRSKRHTENSSAVAKKTTYPVSAGIELLRKFKKSNFDETVELHINTREKGIAGTITLPHGTGKKLRIKIADDALIGQIEQGKIDFDVLVATPDMMPKLAKVARILGPRGLMPNPKNGTISDKPEQVVEKLSAGQVSYKTEPQAPIIHMSVGKLSFADEQLSENISTILSSIGQAKISSVTLKSTMSPAIRIQI